MFDYPTTAPPTVPVELENHVEGVALRVQAFTDLGIENLIELVRFYKETPSWSRAGNGNDLTSLRSTPDAYQDVGPSRPESLQSQDSIR